MANSMDTLYARLNKRGVNKAFAKRLLPDWWDDSMAATPSAFLQAQLIIASGMNFELGSMRDPAAEIQFKAAPRKFKMNKAVDADGIQLSAEFATGMAKLAIQAMEKQYLPPGPDAAAIRNALLQKHACVDLQALIDFCNTCGIPVLHIGELPGKKMDAVAVRQHGRSAIVLTKNASAPYLLFHLAHEIGHIALGHLGDNDGSLIDAKIDSRQVDCDEQAADKFAVQLLNGAEVRYSTSKSYVSAARIASAATSYGQSNRIDAGHIILNYAHDIGNFMLANAALKQLPRTRSGTDIVNSNLRSAINFDALSDDQAGLLSRALTPIS